MALGTWQESGQQRRVEVVLFNKGRDDSLRCVVRTAREVKLLSADHDPIPDLQRHDHRVFPLTIKCQKQSIFRV